MLLSAVAGSMMVAKETPAKTPSWYIWCPEGEGNCIRIFPNEIKVIFKEGN